MSQVLPEFIKSAFGSLPFTGFKRILAGETALRDFFKGERDTLFQGLCNRVQFSIIPQSWYPLPSFNPESIWSRMQLEDALTDIPSEVALYLTCIERECQIADLDWEDSAVLFSLQRWSTLLIELKKSIQIKVDTVRPHGLLYFQGYYPDSAILRQIGIEKGIALVSLEHSAFNKKIIWDTCSGIAVNMTLMKNLYWRHLDSLNASEVKKEAAAYVSQIGKSKSEDHFSPETTFSFPEKKAGKLRVLFLGQVFTDSSLIFGQQEDLDPVTVIQKIDAFCQSRGHFFLLKLHPKEAAGESPIGTPYDSLTLRKLKKSAAWPLASESAIDEKNEWSTYAAIKDSDIIVTQNSQAGIEACLLGKKVILTGKAFYRDCGFTEDARNLRDLEHILSKLERESSIPYETLAVEKFFYVYMKHYAIDRNPKDLFQLIHRNHSF